MTSIKHKIGGKCEQPGCDRDHYGRGLCKPHHQWLWKRGLIGLSNKASVREKIEHYSVPVTEKGCWLWLATTNNKGYGRVSIGNGKSEYAHRASYAQFNGEIPEGMEVCHKCDTPACVNPAHLFLGDHWENMADARRKGRVPPPPKLGPDHPRRILTAEQVAAIRSSSQPAKYWAAVIGCHHETVRSARRGQTYQELPGAIG